MNCAIIHTSFDHRRTPDATYTGRRAMMHSRKNAVERNTAEGPMDRIDCSKPIVKSNDPGSRGPKIQTSAMSALCQLLKSR